MMFHELLTDLNKEQTFERCAAVDSPSGSLEIYFMVITFCSFVSIFINVFVKQTPDFQYWPMLSIDQTSGLSCVEERWLSIMWMVILSGAFLTL